MRGAGASTVAAVGRGAAALAAAVALVLASCAGPKGGQPRAGTEAADPHLIAALRSKVPIDPIELDADPYQTWRGKEPLRAPPGTVCGIKFDEDLVRYRLVTFPSEAEARDAGWAVTHFGACGTCSTLQDLSVYLERPDLTAPVRKCGALGETASLACLEELGFTTACARTWLFDAENTRRECFAVCVVSWIEGEPSADSAGRLNRCLQCDEDRSGPVFKATAGRTRRNSGIRSSIPRPDEEVAHVVHDYLPGVPSNPAPTAPAQAPAPGAEPSPAPSP